MVRKKKKNGILGFIESLTETYKENQYIRIVAVSGVLVVVAYYLAVFFLEPFTIEQGTIDWGIDQGYTTIVHGIVLLAFSLFIIFYPFQKQYKNRGLDAFWKILITFPLGFAIYILFFWQFVAHLPFFNFYHQDYITFGDKITHLLAAFVLTLVAVKWSPRKSTVFVVLLILTVYELFEIVWIVNVAGAYESQWQDLIPLVDVFVEDIQRILTAFISIEEIRELLIVELVDVVPDMIFNGIGVFLGWFFTRKLVAKEEKKQKRKRR